MKITKLDKLGKCLTMKNARERYRYYKTLPPLAPGVKHNDQDPTIVEIVPPTHWAEHYVYAVEGDDIMSNETATFTFINNEPVCWFAQCGMTLQGTDAIKRVFGNLYVADRDRGASVSVAHVCEALQRMAERFPEYKFVFGGNDGSGWKMESTNDPDTMETIREALNKDA